MRRICVWLFLVAIVCLVARTARAETPSVPPAVYGQDLIGHNFPIADFRDPVTAAADIDLPSVAYNSRRAQYLVVWHGAMRATGFNIYAREVSASAVVSPTIVAICAAPRDQQRPSIVYDSRAD